MHESALSLEGTDWASRHYYHYHYLISQTEWRENWPFQIRRFTTIGGIVWEVIGDASSVEVIWLHQPRCALFDKLHVQQSHRGVAQISMLAPQPVNMTNPSACVT